MLTKEREGRGILIALDGSYRIGFFHHNNQEKIEFCITLINIFIMKENLIIIYNKVMGYVIRIMEIIFLVYFIRLI